MTQVFLFGAYKKPRESTWMVVVCLLLLTLAYGLTGYLLPWDNRAYWGTVVTTQMAGKAPMIGPYLKRLLGSEASIGVVTFARFFGLHVLLLPPVTTFLIVLHVYLVRKHGVTPVPGDQGAMKKFFPGQVFKDTVAIFVAFIILVVLAVAVKVPLDRLADPTDTAYIPRPDWYFLFLFQILKVFNGSLEAVGSLVLPTLAILVLLLIPFLDREVPNKLAQRTVAFGVVGFAAIAWTGLTVTAIVTAPKAPAASEQAEEVIQDWQQLPPEALAGIGYFREEQCSSCHNLAEGVPRIGPNLATRPIRRSPQWIMQHFKEPARLVPGSSMPPIRLNDTQLAALATFLLKLTPQNAKALESAPSDAVKGAMVFQANQCGNCHTANGEGMKIGPPLNGLSQHRSRHWVEEQIRNPRAHSPDSVMPAFALSAPEMEQLIAYLFSLPEIKPFSLARIEVRRSRGGWFSRRNRASRDIISYKPGLLPDASPRKLDSTWLRTTGGEPWGLSRRKVSLTRGIAGAERDNPARQD
jgi:ubiquinol-cytochrome c reductase cytochrome b subunit